MLNKPLMLIALFPLLFACSNEDNGLSQVSDVGLIHTELKNKNFLAYMDDNSARLLRCDPETPQPFTRTCQAYTRAILGKADFISAIALPTGGFQRSKTGLHLAELAYQSAVESNQPEKTTKTLSWYRSNITDILDIVTTMESKESVTYFSHDFAYEVTSEALLRTYTDVFSQRTYRYIGEGSSWEEADLCSQLGDKEWTNATTNSDIDKKGAVAVLNNLGSELPAYTIGDDPVKLFSFDGKCGEDRNVIYAERGKVDSSTVTESDIKQLKVNMDSGACDAALPVICSGK